MGATISLGMCVTEWQHLQLDLYVVIVIIIITIASRIICWAYVSQNTHIHSWNRAIVSVWERGINYWALGVFTLFVYSIFLVFGWSLLFFFLGWGHFSSNWQLVSERCVYVRLRYLSMQLMFNAVSCSHGQKNNISSFRWKGKMSSRYWAWT